MDHGAGAGHRYLRDEEDDPDEVYSKGLRTRCPWQRLIADSNKWEGIWCARIDAVTNITKDFENDHLQAFIQCGLSLPPGVEAIIVND